MIEIAYKLAEHVLTIRAVGRLTREDYERAIPDIEQAIRSKKQPLNAVITVERLEGWDLPALWKELKFDVDHYNDLRRIALVGSSGLPDWAESASSLVTYAEVEFFAVEDLDLAQKWAGALSGSNTDTD